MDKILLEALECVRELNENHSDGYVMYKPFELITDGENAKVEFMGTMIWNTVDETRKYDEEKNEWEPLGQYLYKEGCLILDDLIVKMLPDPTINND